MTAISEQARQKPMWQSWQTLRNLGERALGLLFMAFVHDPDQELTRHSLSNVLEESAKEEGFNLGTYFGLLS